MNLGTLLNDPAASLVNVWRALQRRFGDGIAVWEPETFVLEIERLGVEPRASLMTKILAAQTAATTGLFALDHEVLFAFALACDGIPYHGAEIAHPTIEQLAYAIDQLRKLRPDFDPEAHTDPDEVDAAIAVTLHHEGFFVAPPNLAFVQDILDNLTHADKKVTAKVKAAWPAVQEAIADDKRIKILNTFSDERPETVQLKRLAAVVRDLHERTLHDVAQARTFGLV